MLRMVWIARLLAGFAMAKNWQAVAGHQIAAAFSVRGLTLMAARGMTMAGYQPGIGQCRGEQYCAVWPRSDRCACNDLQVGPAGRDLRFVAADGSITIGPYTDLP